MLGTRRDSQLPALSHRFSGRLVPWVRVPTSPRRVSACPDGAGRVGEDEHGEAGAGEQAGDQGESEGVHDRASSVLARMMRGSGVCRVCDLAQIRRAPNIPRMIARAICPAGVV